LTRAASRGFIHVSMQPNKPSAPSVTSHKASTTGLVLAILSLISSAIGNAFIRAKYKPTGGNTTVNEKVGNAVAGGTTHLLGIIFGVPLLIGGITLAIISVIFTLIRLKKVRVGGLILTILIILLAIWSFSIAIGAFDLIRARPAN
jgi:hypothetical protein